MRLVVKPFSQKEWTDIVSGFQDLSLVQTWEYAEAKARTASWEAWRALVVQGDRAIGAVQSLVRKIPLIGGGLVWINRGPLWRRSENEDPVLLRALMEELRLYWVRDHGMYLRIAPAVHEGDSGLGSLEGNGYRLADGSPGWASARLDLFQTIESLRNQLDQKWRNSLNKAERLGITVDCGSDSEFRDALSSYERLLQERKYQTSVTPQLLSRLQSLLPVERKLLAFVGRQGGQELGGILIAKYGETCEYLVGAINEAGRSANAGNLLLWQSICQAKSIGCRWFDLGGLDRKRTPEGILHFKRGLGGIGYRLVSELEAHDGGWRCRAVRWRVRKALDSPGEQA